MKDIDFAVLQNSTKATLVVEYYGETILVEMKRREDGLRTISAFDGTLCRLHEQEMAENRVEELLRQK